MDNCTALVLVKNDQYWLRYTLESTRDLFKNYVFYDVDSEDETREVIEAFCNTLPDDVLIRYRFLPMCPPSVQGCFRNSMIAEAQTDWYFILDGDEVYSEESVNAIKTGFEEFKQAHEKDPKIIYGVLKRIEIGEDLKSAYSEIRNHHRVYHRTAIWGGNHPGEFPIIKQSKETEFSFPVTALCYHFHNTQRSPFNSLALKREERRIRPTYRPGQLIGFDLFKFLPILKNRYDSIGINPVLEKMQNDKM